MPDFQEILEKGKGFWNKFERTQQILIAGGSVFLIVAFSALAFWLTRPDYSLLYAKLTPEDANRVVTFLQAEKISYSLADGGSSIMVPTNEVYNLRIKLAGEGTIVGQGIGLEIFDVQQIGQTEFVQRINLQRALQGELSRTLSEFPLIESARVHLVLPERSLFIEDQQPPSASVVLRLKDPNARIPEREVRGMVNLLVSAVQGLDASRISITDSAGRSLFTPEDETTGLNRTHLEYRVKLENMLSRRIDELLMPVLGPGKHIAKISADLDYSQRTIRKEIFDPESLVTRSEQRSESTQAGSADLGGSVDNNFRGDGLNGAVSTQDSSTESRTTNYEINREEYNIIGQMGELKRLTIAVAVDGAYVKNEGVWEFVPRSEAELASIRQLVANAVGFNAERGDTIEVTTMPFGETEIPYDPNAAQLLADFAERMGGPLLTALLGFLFIMLVVRPLVLALIRPRVEAGEMIEGLEGLPAAEEQYALFEAQEEEAKLAEANAQAVASLADNAEAYSLELGLSLDDIKARALQLAERNLDQTLFVIRSWMKEEKVKA